MSRAGIRLSEHVLPGKFAERLRPLVDDVQDRKLQSDTFSLDPRVVALVVSLPLPEQRELLLDLFRQIGDAANRAVPQGDPHSWWFGFGANAHAAFTTAGRLADLLLARDLGLTLGDWELIFSELAKFPYIFRWSHPYLSRMVDRAVRDAKRWAAPLPKISSLLTQLAEKLSRSEGYSGELKLMVRLQNLAEQLTALQNRTPATASGGPSIEPLPAPSPESIALMESLALDVLDEAGAVRTPRKAGGRAKLSAADPITRLQTIRLLFAHVRDVVERSGTNVDPNTPYTEPYLVKGSYFNTTIRYWIEREPHFVPADILLLISWREIQQSHWFAIDADDALLRHIERLQVQWHPTVAAWIQRSIEAQEQSGRPDRAWLKRARALIGAPPRNPLLPGDVWAEAITADLVGVLGAKSQAWVELLNFATTATSTTPSQSWLKKAREQLAAVGPSAFESTMLKVLPLIDQPRTLEASDGPYEPFPAGSLYVVRVHQEVLKGLLWLCASFHSPHMARVLGQAAISMFRKVPGVGPRAVGAGNAAVYALSTMPGMDALGQLAMLSIKIKFGTAQKAIEKALNAAALREGLARDEIAELAVPAYGLQEVGRRTEEMGDFTAELHVSGLDTELRFVRKDGKLVKSVPASVKADFAEGLKELKAAAKDIGAMLPAQRDRIDSLFLEQKTWTPAIWRERYIDHPLVGTIARRLIWRIADAGSSTSAIWLDSAGGLVNLDAAPVQISDAATIQLWHPILAKREEVLAWRRFVEDRGVRQPFKQAHREVYILTDAEARTETYSNRFAAHIIRQHQFSALCAVRNWKNKLRLMVDAEFPPPTRHLPAHALRAEFWVEPAGEDVNDSQAYLYLASDQVRFCRAGAAQSVQHATGRFRSDEAGTNQTVRLSEVPPLVFSEVMRDVDLFVGVCSVANNPQWQDGGPEGRYRDYWWSVGFGAMSATGEARADLLQRLVPRLKIAGQCRIDGRFVIVKGKLRTYKVHIGSGNILMEPNDQYLCIVPGGRDTFENANIHLPFEGDRVLSIILSKLFMLAEDDKITDASIVSQIKG